MYSNGICSLISNGTTVATIVVRNAIANAPPVTGPAITYDAVRDDGQVVTFTVQGGSIVPPAGSSLRLTLTATGYQLIDDDDNIELYNSNGQLLSVTSRSGIVETMGYDASNRLTTVTDSFGHQLTLGYDMQGRLGSVTDPGANAVTYGYDGQTRLSTVTNLDHTTRTYVYENAALPDLLTGVIDETATRFSTWGYDALGHGACSAEGGSATSNGTCNPALTGVNFTSLVYNADGSVTTTDPLGAVRTFTFQVIGEQNRVTSISGSQCPTCAEPAATTYDAAGFVSSRTDYDGNLTCYANDPVRGLELVRVEGMAPGNTCPANLASYTPSTAPGSAERKITTQWHPTWWLPQIVAEPNRLTTYIYNGDTDAGATVTCGATGALCRMRVSETTDTTGAAGLGATLTGTPREWDYTYNAYGEVLTAKDPQGNVTTYAYNTCTTGGGCGELATIVDAANHKTTFMAYDAYGMPTALTDPNNTAISLTHDARERLKSYQVGTDLTKLAYYPTGLLQTVTLPDGSTVTYTYDAAHRLTDITDGAGNTLHYGLDAMGNRTSETVKDPQGVLSRTTSQNFNTLSELYQVIGAANTAAVTTTLSYDANGNLKTSAAPLGRNTTNYYDALNRLIQITDPNSGNTYLGYDGNDDLSQVTDPNGLVTSYQRDGFGEVKTLSSPDTGSTAYTYYPTGHVHTVTDARGAVATYTDDVLNRVQTIAYAQGGNTDQTITYSYDQGTNGIGQLTGASDASHSMSWTYDPQGHLSGESQTVAGVTLAVGYTFTNANLTTLTTPSGQTVVYSYSNHQVTAITVNGTPLLSNAVYEPFGPVRGWAWGNGTSEVRLHNEDGNPSQLSGVESVSLSYDDAFRLIGSNNSANSTLSWTYGYDSLDRLASASTSGETLGWHYDDNGNRTQQTGAPASIALPHANTYTYNDRGRLGSVTANGVTTNYTYDALGQLIEKSVGGTITLLVYDQAGHLLGEYGSTGQLIQETIWLGDLPVATLRPNTGGGIDIDYVHADQIGAPRMVTRASDNAILWRWDTDPFGTTAPNEDPQGIGTFVYNLRFPGQYYQAESGIDYNYFRDYDPNIGRFVESDSIGLYGGSFSTYAYVDSAPLMHADIAGLGGLEISGSALHEILNDIPDSICDLWPAHCIGKLVVCAEARCKYKGKCGDVWFVTVTSWLPTPPTIEEITKETPNCECVKWKLQEPE